MIPAAAPRVRAGNTVTIIRRGITIHQHLFYTYNSCLSIVIWYNLHNIQIKNKSEATRQHTVCFIASLLTAITPILPNFYICKNSAVRINVSAA